MPDLRQTERALWRRLLLGAVLLVFTSATATALAGFREIDRVVAAFRDGRVLDLGQSLSQSEAGEPQTLLLLGSDARPRWSPNHEDKTRSDTIILVRLDPSRNATKVLSLPRDLKVQVPGHGTGKLNSAYEDGGPRLALETVKTLTGLRINHVINMDFGGFRKAVNAIGCVYVDIDRRYFNNNPAGFQSYATINVPAGYQRMCGNQALDFVRYRHEDNDIVRAARQQAFMREAKQQVSVGDLISDRQRLIEIFGRYTSSDIQSRSEVVRLVKLAVGAAGRPVQEVHFKGQIGPSYVTARPDQIRTVVGEFLSASSAPPPAAKPQPERSPGRSRTRSAAPRPVPLADASVEGRLQAESARNHGARIPVYYPYSRAPGSTFVDQPRVYGLDVPAEGRSYPSYRMVLKYDEIGQYYGVQGTAWKHPPILSGPSETRRINGRTFEIFRDGDRVRLVAWRTPEAVYWVSNTLLQSFSDRQIVAIAASTRPL